MTHLPLSPVTATLKPCPFCGAADAELEFGPEHRHWPAVRCNECGTLGPSIKLKHDEAVALWNARTSDHAQNAKEPTLLRQAEECLKDWLNYAEEHLSEFDIEDDECPEDKLCPKCERAGCIQYKIRETRHAVGAIAALSDTSTDRPEEITKAEMDAIEAAAIAGKPLTPAELLAPIGGTESCTCHFLGAGRHHVPGCPFYIIATSVTSPNREAGK